MWFCGPKEKKEEIEDIEEVYYVPFDCSNCHRKDMVYGIKKGVRITEVEKDRQIKCSKCGCYTSFEEGTKIAEKEKNG